MLGDIFEYQKHAQRKKEKLQKEMEEIDSVKLRRAKKQQDKQRKEKEYIKSILEPNIKNNLLEWKAKDYNLNLLEGYFKNNLIFEIKRGMISFSLNIVHEECKKHYKQKHSSTELVKLQEKANKILSELVAFLKVS